MDEPRSMLPQTPPLSAIFLVVSDPCGSSFPSPGQKLSSSIIVRHSDPRGMRPERERKVRWWASAVPSWSPCSPKRRGKLLFLSRPLPSLHNGLVLGMREQSKRGRETGCYGVNVCVSPNFMCWNLKSQGDSIRMWSLGEVIWSWGQRNHHEWD